MFHTKTLAHLADGPVQVDGRLLLGMDGDDVRTGLGKVSHAQLGLDDHLHGRKGSVWVRKREIGGNLDLDNVNKAIAPLGTGKL